MSLPAIIRALKRDERDPGLWAEFWRQVSEAGPSNDPAYLRIIARALSLDGMDHTLAEREAQYLVAALFHRCVAGGKSCARFVLDLAHGDAERQLILSFLNGSVTGHRDLEYSLTMLRRELLDLVTAGIDPAREVGFLQLAAALAVHCFRHEYVFPESPAESSAIAKLGAMLGAAFVETHAPDPNQIAILAAYRPLGAEPWANKVAATLPPNAAEALGAVMRQQILAANEERQLRAAIPSPA